MSIEQYEVDGTKFEIHTEYKGAWWGKWICKKCGDSRYAGQPCDDEDKAAAAAKAHASTHFTQVHK